MPAEGSSAQTSRRSSSPVSTRSRLRRSVSSSFSSMGVTGTRRPSRNRRRPAESRKNGPNLIPGTVSPFAVMDRFWTDERQKRVRCAISRTGYYTPRIKGTTVIRGRDGPVNETGAKDARDLRRRTQELRGELMNIKKVKRLGVMVLSLSALAGVTQASNMRQMILGSTESAPKIETKLSAAAAAPAQATADSSAVNTTEEQPAASAAPNIVDLVGDSEFILRGLVKEVTDGFENGVPYTQVTVQVSEAFRGQVGEEYTFRQFGLTKPKKMENGKVYLGVTPEGWSKYTQGEDVVLFLYKQASMTGLRTTVGLGQGKLEVSGGNVTSQFGNEGLFENVEVSNNLLDDRDKRMLGTKKGPVNTESFVSFVRRAVKGNWVKGGKMRHVKK